MAQIRASYAAAKEMIAHNNEILEAQNQLFVNGSFMCPGTGHRDELIQYYFFSTYKEDAHSYVCIPYFIMRSYNVAVRRFYEEMLYDDEGHLIFFYSKADNFEGGADEARYYWSAKGRLVHSQLQGQPDYDEAMAGRLSSDLLEAFNRLMNRDY